MLNKIAFVAIALVLLQLPTAWGQVHFKRFPATVTNDGAYVLAWGIMNDQKGDVTTKTEISPDGPELADDVESEGVEDYLVDTASGKIVATIPDFDYYDGSEGRRNHFGLEVGWSPDNHGGIAIYDSRYDTAGVVWISPAEHKITDIYPQIEKAVRGVSVKKLGKDAADYQIAVSNPVFVTPRRVILHVMVGNLSSKMNPEASEFDALFNVKGDLAAPKLELSKAKWVPESAETESNPHNEDDEAALNRVYNKLKAALSGREREDLKQEQLKWLATREHLGTADDQKFVQEDFTRRRISELEARLRYRYRKPAAWLLLSVEFLLNIPRAVIRYRENGCRL